MKTGPNGRITLSAALLVAVALLVAACGGNGTAAASSGCKTVTANVAASTAAGSGSSSYADVDLANTRDATGSTISSANVSRLAQAWTFKLTGSAAVGVRPYGSLTASPIVQNGVVYLQDLDSNVYALALATGKLRWEYRCNQPEKSGPGPNGVAVADGKVYGLTPTAAFALNANTGRASWVNSDLLRKGQGTFGIQPQVANGRDYLASQYGSGPGGGVLLALNASSGAVLWRFNTAVGPEPGVQSLGLGSGGAWETPLVSRDGSVTYGTGNPYQTPAAAIAHPAVELYTDSDVNLDAATGKLRWYYQGIPDDFKDYDMQTSPIAARTHVLANLAVARKSVYVATIDLPLTYPTFSLPTATKAAGRPTGDVEALSLTTGKVEWDQKLPQFPLGAVTVSNDLAFTTLYNGVLIALDRRTGAVVYRRQLPTSANSPIAIAGNTVIVPAGGPATRTGGGNPQVVAYTMP
jgi:outer membrane protein assembly factor BamB